MPSSPNGTTITAGFEGSRKSITEMNFRMKNLPSEILRASVRWQRKAHIENLFFVLFSQIHNITDNFIFSK